MTRCPNLEAILHEVGPRFATGAAERDAGDVFAAEHYDRLKEHRVFSALVPAALGGGGASYSAMCAFLRGLAHYCPSTALAVAMHQHLVAAAVYNHRKSRPGQMLLELVAAKEAVLISTGANDWLEFERHRGARRWRLSGQRPQAVRQRLTQRRTCQRPRRCSRIRNRVGGSCTSLFRSQRLAFRSPMTGEPSACVPPARTPSRWTRCSSLPTRSFCGGRAGGSIRRGT